MCINDVDLNLYVPKAVEETGITVASPERFSTYTSVEKDGELFFFPVSQLISQTCILTRYMQFGLYKSAWIPNEVTSLFQNLKACLVGL